LPYFARKNTIMAYLKKHGLKLAFFAPKFRLPYQKRANPGSFRAPLVSGMHMSVSQPQTRADLEFIKKIPYKVSFFAPFHVITNK
jgi:hypothetical protein